ncbi:MAG TPA: hypothetical protein VMS04_06790 [Vicinamibacterales bacterium]|nr:hypothetical protein [Vicinamibacterales bacterium]
MTDSFNGFPRETFTFFRQLAQNNNRETDQAGHGGREAAGRLAPCARRMMVDVAATI